MYNINITIAAGHLWRMMALCTEKAVIKAKSSLNVWIFCLEVGFRLRVVFT